MSSMRVSVGMPVYNSEGFLPTAIEGVLAQTFGDFELIISDNCSTDGSASLCEEYARRDSRIRFERSSQNRGAPANFNRVFELSRAPYFVWASSNDYFAPTFLEKAVRVLDERPDVVVCCCRTRYFDGEPARFQEVEDPMHLCEESPVERFNLLLSRMRINNVMHGLIRAEDLRRTRLHAPYFSSDVAMVAELSLAGKVYQLDEPLFYRRMEEAAASIMLSDEELRHLWKADSASRMGFQHWRRELAYWSMLARSRLSLSDRARLAVLLAKRLYWSGPDLLTDIREAWR